AAPSPGESWKRPKLTGSPSSRIPSPSKRCASWTSGRRSLLKFTTWWRRSWRSSTASPAEAQRTSRWPVPEQKRERPERALRPNGKTAQAAAPQARILPDKTHQHVHQLVDGRVAFGVLDRPRDAAPGVVFEKHQSHLVEGRLHRGDLDQDVDAVLVLLDHPADAAHLAFDPLQPPQQLGLVPLTIFVHRFASPPARVGGGRPRHFSFAAMASAISRVPTAVGSFRSSLRS